MSARTPILTVFFVVCAWAAAARLSAAAKAAIAAGLMLAAPFGWPVRGRVGTLRLQEKPAANNRLPGALSDRDGQRGKRCRAPTRHQRDPIGTGARVVVLV